MDLPSEPEGVRHRRGAGRAFGDLGRAPQYTAELRPGDPVRDLEVGQGRRSSRVGRLASEPCVVPMSPDEQRFITGASEDDHDSTRVLIRVVRCTTVHKDVVAALPEFAEHQIIQAPRGTVFVVGDAQWSALASLLPAPPEADRVDLATVPEPFSWSQRSKSVHPLPGGYDGYLQALRALLDTLVDQRPAVNDFPQVVTELYSVTDNRANLMTLFLKKITVVAESGGVAVPSEWASAWRNTARNEIIIGLLHSRVRFVGEMLAETRQPRTVSQLLEIANVLYDMSWSTQAQIARRRGWLQSAGYLSLTRTNDSQLRRLAKRSCLSFRSNLRSSIERRHLLNPRPLFNRCRLLS